MELIKSIIDFILHIDKHLAVITNDYQGWTYLLLFAIIFAETGLVVTPFLPGDSLIFAAAALIAGGHSGLNIFVLGPLLVIAAFTGNMVNYEIGKHLGIRVFKPGNKILKLEYYLKTQAFFNQHGGKAVIFSRFIPIIRTIAPFVAGVGRMSFLKYNLYNIVGGASWVISFLVIGYFFGNLPVVKENFTIVILVIILVSVAPPMYAAIKGKAGTKTV